MASLTTRHNHTSFLAPPSADNSIRTGSQLWEKFERWIQPHRSSLRAHAWQLTHNTADAEDLVQDTLLRACRYLDRVNGLGSIRSWLFTSQINIFRNEYRRRVRFAEITTIPSGNGYLTDVVEATTSPSPEEEFLQQERHQAVREAIVQLSQSYRAVIFLVDVEELSYQEAADRLSIPIGTVRSRVFRARRLLAKALTV